MRLLLLQPTSCTAAAAAAAADGGLAFFLASFFGAGDHRISVELINAFFKHKKTKKTAKHPTIGAAAASENRRLGERTGGRAMAERSSGAQRPK